MRLADELAGSAATDVVPTLIADSAELDPTRTAAGGQTGAPVPAGSPEGDVEIGIDPTASPADEAARIGLDGPADESPRGIEVGMDAGFGMAPTEAAIVGRDSPADETPRGIDVGMDAKFEMGPTDAAVVAGKNDGPPRGTESPDEGRTERTIMGILEKKETKTKQIVNKVIYE